MGFVERCAAAAGLRLDDPGVQVDERGLQHLVIIDHRRGMVARFPRRSAGCRLIEDASARLSMLHGHGIPVPRVLGVQSAGGPGRAHLLLSYLPGHGLDTIDTDALPAAAQDRLVAGLIRTTAAIHDLPTAPWPSPGPAWTDLWSGLVQQVHECGELPPETRDRQEALARAALAVAERARIGIFHGDLGGVNCRVDPETGAVTGVLDWDSAAIGDVATDLVAVLHGVGPRTASRLRSVEARWDAAWSDYRTYVRTWPVQSFLWSLRSGGTGQRGAALRLLSDPPAGRPR